MPRPWRTVYKSSHKKVLVKPRNHRNHHSTAHVHVNTSSGQSDMDLSWLWTLAQWVIGLVFILFTIEFLIGAWPYLLAAFFIFLIIA